MKTIIAKAATSLVVFSSAAYAGGLQETLSGIDVSVSGFGTFGGVVTDTNDAIFVRDQNVVGATKTPSYKVDSNLGVQFSAKANSWLSATVQVLDEQRPYSKRLTADFAWAFVKISPLEALNFNAYGQALDIELGRYLAPLFLVSDSLNINYANTWVRAPNEVYALPNITEVSGAQAKYSVPIASSHLNITGFAGNGNWNNGSDQGHVYDVHGADVRWDIDWLTVRLGLTTTENQRINATTLARTEDKYSFSGAGLIVDRNNILAQVEAVSRRSHDAPTRVNSNGWYALGGYRFGKILPYAYYARTDHVRPIAAGYSFSFDQSTKAVGVRWDAFSSADIKFQFEHVDPYGTKGISFTSIVPVPSAPQGTPFPGTSPNFGGTQVNVVSLTLDFVF